MLIEMGRNLQCFHDRVPKQVRYRWKTIPKVNVTGIQIDYYELELIQSHMAQKPVLRGEVWCACVAREVSVERGGMGVRGCARRLGGV